MIVFNGLSLTSEDVKVLNPAGLIAGNSARTYSAWVKLEPNSFGTIIAQGSLSSYNRSAFIVDTRDGIDGNVGSLLSLDFQVGYVQARNLPNLADNNWHMLTVTFDPTASNSGVSFFVDGQLVLQ